MRSIGFSELKLQIRAQAKILFAQPGPSPAYIVGLVSIHFASLNLSSPAALESPAGSC
jgi:hypothetical protein